MANTRYENFVLENELKDQLNTRLNMLDYLTPDDSLMSTPGMTKKVHVYSATGEAEDVAEGEGNTQSIEMSYTAKDYVVGTTQGRFIYTDEDEMTDDFMVEAGMSKLSESLTNHLRAKVAAEYWNATRYIGYAKGTDTVGFSHFVDAIALLNKEDDAETEAQLFALCDPNMKAALRKALKDDLKYNEDYARTGYIGHVAGVPLRTSKLIPDGCVIIASKKAVKYFYKKDVEIERERDANTRTNKVYGRQVGLVAFVDEGECAIIAPNGAAPTITTASIAAGSAVAITGACAEGARVEVLRNGAKIGDAAVTGATWNYTIDTATAAEKYSVRQYVPGFAAATSEAKTVAGE